MDALPIIAALVALVALGGGIFWATQNPAFVGGLIKWAIKSAIDAILPEIVKAVKPKDYTEKQLDNIKAGKMPGGPGQAKRPDEGGKR